MKEFMLYIRNEKDAKKTLTPAEHAEFIKRCEVYISELKNEHRLIAAQPLERTGMIVKKTEGSWMIIDISGNEEVQVGYYHILATDLDDAVRIAKDNPEFAFVPSTSIEVRPVKTKEQETGFVYPVTNR
jgi:hypothetical protein